MEKEQIAQLVESVRSGDKKAFEKLYNETNKGAYFVAFKITGNEDDAMDILQDSYIKALDKLDQLKDSSTFVSWFNQIVANTAKNYLCKKKPVLFNTEEDEQASQDWQIEEDSDFIPEESLDTSETRKAIMDIIDALPEDRRLCVLMHYFDDMGTAQIAKALEIPEGTVKSHLVLARKSIKKTIEELRKQGKTVLGTSAIPFFIWLLRRMSTTVVMSQEQASALLTVIKGTSVLLGGAAATASASVAVIGSTAVKVGVVGKIIATVTVPKIVAAVVGASVIAAGVTAGVTIAKKDDGKPSETASSGTYYDYNNESYSFEDAGIVFEDEEKPSEPVPEELISAEGSVDTDNQSGDGSVHNTKGNDHTTAGATMQAGASAVAGTDSENPEKQPQTATSADKGTTKKTSATTAGKAETTAKTTQTTDKVETTVKKAETTAKKTETTAKKSETTVKKTTAATKSTTKKEETSQKKTTTQKATTTKKPTTTRKPTTTKKETTTTPITTTKPTTTKPTTTQALDFEYTVSGSSATITGYKGSGGSVSIPSEIDGATVTAIGNYAFENESGITSVSVPSSVKSIGKGAFANCTSLTRVSLPSGITSLGTTVFKSCNNLTSINIPSGLSSIPAGAFQGCSALTSVTIPSSVTSIGTNAFDSCPNLTINCTAGSAAETYAKNNGIPYTV